MSKKLRRLELAKLKSYLGKGEYLHFVTVEQRVHLAKLVEMNGIDLTIKNAMGHLLPLSLKEIDEIWADESVSS